MTFCPEKIEGSRIKSAILKKRGGAITIRLRIVSWWVGLWIVTFSMPPEARPLDFKVLVQGEEKIALVGEVHDENYIISKGSLDEVNVFMSGYMRRCLADYQNLNAVSTVVPCLREALVRDTGRYVMLGEVWQITMNSLIRYHMKNSFKKLDNRCSVDISRHLYADNCSLPFDMPLAGEYGSSRVFFSPEKLRYNRSYRGKHYFKVTYNRGINSEWVEQVKIYFFTKIKPKKSGRVRKVRIGYCFPSRQVVSIEVKLKKIPVKKLFFN